MSITILKYTRNGVQIILIMLRKLMIFEEQAIKCITNLEDFFATYQ